MRIKEQILETNPLSITGRDVAVIIGNVCVPDDAAGIWHEAHAVDNEEGGGDESKLS